MSCRYGFCRGFCMALRTRRTTKADAKPDLFLTGIKAIWFSLRKYPFYKWLSVWTVCYAAYRLLVQTVPLWNKGLQNNSSDVELLIVTYFPIRPPLVYYLFPVPISSKTEAGGRCLIFNYANELMQNVVYIRFNHCSITFHYHCNALNNIPTKNC